LRNKSKPLHEIDGENLREFFYYLSERKIFSTSSLRIYKFSIQFYYLNTLQKHLDFSLLTQIRKSDHLPTVLSREEILSILHSFANPKHRLIFSLMYAGGLRISEVIQIKVKDLDFQKLTIHIRQGKAKKDRITIFL
jgi:integrase/recombinase XerD